MFNRFDRFNYRARQLVAATLHEALNTRAKALEPEHLALALLRDDAVTARFFPPPKAEAARSAIVARCGEPIVGPYLGELPASRSTSKVFKRAVQCAQEMNHAYAGSEHVLLALLIEKTPIAALLHDIGMSGDAVRSAIAGQGESFAALG